MESVIGSTPMPNGAAPTVTVPGVRPHPDCTVALHVGPSITETVSPTETEEPLLITPLSVT